MYPMCNISKGIIFPFIIGYFLKLFGEKYRNFHLLSTLWVICPRIVLLLLLIIAFIGQSVKCF